MVAAGLTSSTEERASCLADPHHHPPVDECQTLDRGFAYFGGAHARHQVTHDLICMLLEVATTEHSLRSKGAIYCLGETYWTINRIRP